MLSELITLASKVASIYDKKQSTKYRDEIIESWDEIQNEELKPIPDDGRISFLRLRIMRICKELLKHPIE